MWILNTRPQERQQQLSSELEQLGYPVKALPLLELHALPLDKLLQRQFQQFLQADIVIVVSSIAAKLGMKYYQSLNFDLDLLQKKQWVAVGLSTQKTLSSFAIQSVVPQLETSEGMLQLAVLQDINNKKIAFWRGIGGRELMLDSLQQMNCQTLNMLLYTRQQPNYTAAYLQQTCGILPAIILISSEESWKNWLNLAQQHEFMQQHLMQNVYVVLGDRVTTIVQQYFQRISVQVKVFTIYHLTAQAIHQQLQ